MKRLVYKLRTLARYLLYGYRATRLGMQHCESAFDPFPTDEEIIRAIKSVQVHYTATLVFLLTGTTSWTVPADWNNSSNTIEAIGHAGTSSSGGSGGAGGGGAYAKITNQTLTAGSVTVKIGTHGSTTEDTFFKDNSSTTVLLAARGKNATSTSGAAGGLSSACTGTTKFSGGNGGSYTSSTGNPGGGGAAGPSGAGGNGADNVSNVGGNGGTGNNGTETGGAHGNPGSPGVNGTEFDGTHGSGSGGGGADSNGIGGIGGNYGAAGGSGGTLGTSSNGLIAISYTAITGPTVDAASNSTYQAAASTYSWSHTCTGTNLFLAVDISMLSVPGTTVTGITYNSVALSFIGRSTATGAVMVEQWGLINPATGAHTIAVTLSASITSAGTAVSYAGVHQTSPTEEFNSNSATNVGAADATVIVDTISDNCIIHAAISTTDGSVTANQTTRNNVTGASGSGANEDTGPVTPAGSTTMSYTGVGAAAVWVICGYGIRPVADAILVSVLFGPYSRPQHQTQMGM